ncbi:MAG: AI-2E family transporter [Oscillospiraceae bacterium]|nr:AI-2E family transporter [Oscillospiraceae bacterium]
MQKQKKFSLKNNRLAKTIIVSGTVLIIVAFIILRYEGFIGLLSAVLAILRPIIIGCVIAFVLNRPMNFFHARYRTLFNRIKKSLPTKKGKNKERKSSERPSFIMACITTYLLSLAILVGIVCFIIPQISDSIALFSSNVNGYIENLKNFIDTHKINDLNGLMGFDIDITQMLDNIVTKIKEEVSNLFEYIPSVLMTTLNITSGIISIIVDTVIGLVFSLYILLDKRSLKKNAKALTQLVIKGRHYDKFENVIKISYRSFSNFISGQFIEAFILGILCFIGMSIFGFEYAPLISVIIGITNMIPIAGPIIGTIPSAAILLLVNPIDAVWFVVFIIVIQQIDSNIIYPKVVGNSVGLPALWVLFAITIGGGLGGVVGMILGVPVLSVVYALVGEKLRDEEAKRESVTEG